MSNHDPNATDTFKNRIKKLKTKKISGTYLLKHDLSGQFYVGSSINMGSRHTEHIKDLRNGEHCRKALQKLYDQDPNFTFENTPFGVSEGKEMLEQVRSAEQTLLDKFRGDPLLLNSATDAKLPWKGMKHSDETKAKMSASAMGRPISQRALDALVERNKTVVVSDETRRRMSDAHKNSPRAADVIRRKMKPVLIDGVSYESATDAARQLGLSQGCVRKRVFSDDEKFQEWKLA